MEILFKKQLENKINSIALSDDFLSDLVAKVLLLYCMYLENIDSKEKSIQVAKLALQYFISDNDAIDDSNPHLGFVDDIEEIENALKKNRKLITETAKSKAENLFALKKEKRIISL